MAMGQGVTHGEEPSGDVRCAGGTHCNILVVGGGDGDMPRSL